MSNEANTEFQTIIGPDANFKGEMSFEKAVRVQGGFEGKVRTGGTLHIAEGAKVSADIEAGVLRVDGELKGNVNISGKLTLSNTARMEGDLKTNRLEMADGAVFIGNVIVGSSGGGSAPSFGGDGARREPSALPSVRPVETPPPVRPRPPIDAPALNIPNVSIPARG